MSTWERLPGLALAAGAGALVLTVPVVLGQGSAAKELPWIAGTGFFLASAAWVHRRRRGTAIARWFALAGGLVALVQALDGLLLRAGGTSAPELVALLAAAYQSVSVLGGIALTHLLGLFPDGCPERRWERQLLRGLWLLLTVPLLGLLVGSAVVLPAYHRAGTVANPFAVEALRWLEPVVVAVLSSLQGVFVLGVALLVARYRRAERSRRRQIRWLLIPTVFASGVAVADLVLWRTLASGAPSAAAEIGLSALWIVAIASLPLAIAVGVLRPDLLDVDRLLRRTLVYGVLWAIIAVAYVGIAATLGIAAGRRLPLGVAIAIAVGATVLFQPARARLERLADRWVFGTRTDPAQIISQLGAALEGTIELESLLPRMADTLQEGLGVAWARVRLDGAPPPRADTRPPALRVPIELDGELLGVVECGPAHTGRLPADAEALVRTFARQAALAVRNVRLTAELDRSRARLVRAQEHERRRLERDLHDGVQQDLVALLGHTARVRAQLEHGRAAGQAALDELQDGLRHVLGELRELAHGIHPSVLGDRGLLEAVESLAARSAIPVAVRADASLRGMRFPEEVEGAGYFTVAEALANASKHAAAEVIDVTLVHRQGDLAITVHDDGAGFDPATMVGEGLANLAERVAALGGKLQVDASIGTGTTVTAHLRLADG